MSKSFYDIKQDVYYRIKSLRKNFDNNYKYSENKDNQIIKILWYNNMNTLAKIDYKNRIVIFYRDNIHFSDEIEYYFKDIFSDKYISYNIEEKIKDTDFLKVKVFIDNINCFNKLKGKFILSSKHKGIISFDYNKNKIIMPNINSLIYKNYLLVREDDYEKIKEVFEDINNNNLVIFILNILKNIFGKGIYIFDRDNKMYYFRSDKINLIYTIETNKFELKFNTDEYISIDFLLGKLNKLTELQDDIKKGIGWVRKKYILEENYK